MTSPEDQGAEKNGSVLFRASELSPLADVRGATVGVQLLARDDEPLELIGVGGKDGSIRGSIWSLSLDGEYIVVATSNTEVFLFSLTQIVGGVSSPLCNLPSGGLQGTLYSTAFRGDLICAGDRQGLIVVWSLEKALADLENCRIRDLHGHRNDINSMRFVDENVLVSGSTDDTIRIWHLTGDFLQKPGLKDSNEAVRTLNCHQGTVWDVSSTPDGSIFTGSTDRTIIETNWITGTVLGTMHGSKRWVMCVAVAGEFVVSGDEDSTVYIWTRSDYQLIHSVKLSRLQERRMTDVWSICATPHYFFAGGSDGTVRILSYEGEEVANLVFEGTGDIHDIHFFPSGLMAVAQSGSVLLYQGACVSTGMVKSAAKR